MQTVMHYLSLDEQAAEETRASAAGRAASPH
jgi:hypothetical protein